MIIAASVRKFFTQYKIGYQVFSHAPTVTLLEAQRALQIPAKTFARSVLLGDRHGRVLVVLPLTHKIDFTLLNKQMKRKLTIVSGNEVDNIFHDCEPGSHPIIGEAYGLRMVIDPILKKQPYIYFEPGTHTSVVRLTQANFRFIHAGATWTKISVPMETKDKPSSAWPRSKDIQDKLTNLYNPCPDQVCKIVKESYLLPPLPSLAHDILAMTRQSEPCMDGLKNLIEQDPNMSQWLLNYANDVSPKPCLNIHQSIDCFGVERLGQMAMGVVAGRAFQVQKSGPLGLGAFWKHAFHSAQLCRQLSLKANIHDVNPSTAFLCGLMHNFGILLFGHLFAPEFKLLNKMYTMSPQLPIQLLEQKILGFGKANQVIKVGHAGMGAWLLKSWGLQDEVVAVAANHHNAKYQGPYQNYVRLMYVANSLLKGYGIGDGSLLELEHLPLNDIGLSPTQIEECLEGEAFDSQHASGLSVGIAR